MKARCYIRSHVGYPRYGGRGVKVCDRWLYGDGNRSGFECFLADMGRVPEPTRKYSLDRFPDNCGDYEPSNCRWATARQQNLNSSQTKFVVLNGERLKFSDAFDKYALPGLRRGTVMVRIHRGEPPETALTRPSTPGKPAPGITRAAQRLIVVVN
jgi:hypothetical protein